MTVNDLQYHVNAWLATAETPFPDEIVGVEQGTLTGVSKVLEIVATDPVILQRINRALKNLP